MIQPTLAPIGFKCFIFTSRLFSRLYRHISAFKRCFAWLAGNGDRVCFYGNQSPLAGELSLVFHPTKSGKAIPTKNPATNISQSAVLVYRATLSLHLRPTLLRRPVIGGIGFISSPHCHFGTFSTF